MITMNYYSNLNVVHLPGLLDTDPDTLLAKLLLAEQSQVAAVLPKRRMIRNVNGAVLQNCLIVVLFFQLSLILV